MVTEEGVLFIFDDCVARHEMHVKATNRGGYEKSSLKKWIDTELLAAFPDWLRDRIDKLSIPTLGEMFGHTDNWDQDAFITDTDEQLPLMKFGRNRVAYYNNENVWLWLRNATRKKESSSDFAIINSVGYVNRESADALHGIRPEFWLIK